MSDRVTRSRLVRRVALVFGLTVAMAVTIGGLGTVAADADTATSITIDSPTAGSTVSGDVSVTATIDGASSTNSVYEVDFGVYGGGGVQTQEVNTSSGQCTPTCTLSVTFHTASFVVPTNPDGAQAISDLPDGSTQFSVTAYTTLGPDNSKTVVATLDNHRPTVDLPDLEPGANGERPTWTSSGADLSTDVAATPNSSSGQPITSLRLMSPNSPVTPLADVSVPAPSGGTGLVTFDVSKVRPGNYFGYLAAVDSAGVTSNLIKLAFTVTDTYEIDPEASPGYTDRTSLTVTPDWYDGSTADQTWLTEVTAKLNGTVIGLVNPDSHDTATVPLADPDGGPLPAGESFVLVTAVDNRGIERSQDVDLKLTDPVAATWTVGTLIAGSPVSAKAQVTDQSSSPVHTLTLGVDGTTVAKAIDNDGTTPPTQIALPNSTALTPGTHTLAVTATLANGVSYSDDRIVAVRGRATVTLTAPSSTTWGHDSAFRATLSMGSAVQKHVTLALQSKRPGATSWTTRRTAATDGSGHAAFSVPVATTGIATWRVTAPASQVRLAAQSSSHAVAALVAFTGLPKSTTTRGNHLTHQRLIVAPANDVKRVIVQDRRGEHSSWRDLSTVTVPDNGHVRLPIKLAAPGNYAVRVACAATSLTAATTSVPWRVHVTG